MDSSTVKNNKMIKYYISTIKQTSGSYEIHTEDCQYMPAIKNRMLLGSFYSDQQAIRLAKLTFPNSIGCQYCLKDFNT